MTAPVAAVASEAAAGTGAEGSSLVASKTPATARMSTRPSAGRRAAGSAARTAGSPAGRSAGSTAAGAAAGSSIGNRSGGRSASKGKGGGGSGPKHSHAGRVLIAEFIGCLAIVALSGLTDKHKDDSPGDLIKRLSGVTALFVLLGLLSSGGRSAGRIAAAFGGVVTVTLLVSDRDVLTVITNRFGTPSSTGAAGPDDSGTVTVANPTAATVPGLGGGYRGYVR